MSSIPDLLKTPVKGRHANAESLKQSVEAIEGYYLFLFRFEI